MANDSVAHGVCTNGQVPQNRKIALSELSLLNTDIVTGLFFCLYCWDDPMVFGQEGQVEWTRTQRLWLGKIKQVEVSEKRAVAECKLNFAHRERQRGRNYKWRLARVSL